MPAIVRGNADVHNERITGTAFVAQGKIEEGVYVEFSNVRLSPPPTIKPRVNSAYYRDKAYIK